jgi:hypothetical protein
MLGIVAKYADAYNTDMLLNVNDASGCAELLAIVADACRKVGRDPATLRKTSGCSLGLEGCDDVPGGPPSVLMRGSTDEIVDKLGAIAALDVDHFSFWLHPWTPQSVERLAPIVEAAHKL